MSNASSSVFIYENELFGPNEMTLTYCIVKFPISLFTSAAQRSAYFVAGPANFRAQIPLKTEDEKSVACSSGWPDSTNGKNRRLTAKNYHNADDDDDAVV